ncbi:hypothetical protein ATN79_43765 [Paraburkholderia caribensis]|nr:hypothetical protein ATN79_43765 [Paraburkholderia caribensis]CAG9188992.1 conserved membrane hypothetical protein [Paraburkholderia caribensis]
MSHMQSTMRLRREQPDHVLTTAKKVALLSPVSILVATVFAYFVYAGELAASSWTWKIGLLVMLLCICGPLAVSFTNRGTNSLKAFGVVTMFGLFVAYFFFGIFGYFYYFVFAPMPAYIRWPGLLGGIALTACWMLLARKSVLHTIARTRFVAQAFVDNGDEIVYDVQRGMKAYERFNKERSPFPRIFMYLSMGIAPFYLILSRLLSENFGANGVLLFVAILGMPVSLWFAGVLVRTWLVMIALPAKMTKEQGKAVVVSD